MPCGITGIPSEVRPFGKLVNDMCSLQICPPSSRRPARGSRSRERTVMRSELFPVAVDPRLEAPGPVAIDEGEDHDDDYPCDRESQRVILRRLFSAHRRLAFGLG